jgi:hypothetical protein
MDVEVDEPAHARFTGEGTPTFTVRTAHEPASVAARTGGAAQPGREAARPKGARK